MIGPPTRLFKCREIGMVQLIDEVAMCLSSVLILPPDAHSSVCVSQCFHSLFATSGR